MLCGVFSVILQVLDWEPSNLSTHLSFGLQQLICVARAMYEHWIEMKSAPVTAIRCSKARIILADEAAAHVDDETEHKISMAFVRAASQGRTVFSVAHRYFLKHQHVFCIVFFYEPILSRPQSMKLCDRVRFSFGCSLSIVFSNRNFVAGAFNDGHFKLFLKKGRV